MKRTKGTRWRMLNLLLLLILPLIGGCGSSSNNEPDDPDNSKISGMISPDILPGNWLLESFTPEEGATITINQPFVILPFTVKQESTNIVTNQGYQYWAENYNPFTQVNTVDDIVENYATVGFSKAAGAGLNTSKIYELAFTLADSDDNGTYIVVMADMSYDKNILISNVAAYSHHVTGGSYIPQNGKLIMRKTN